MNSRFHPVSRTLVFMVLVGLVSTTIMLRPASFQVGKKLFPLWADLAEPSSATMQPHDVDILLAAYESIVDSSRKETVKGPVIIRETSPFDSIRNAQLKRIISAPPARPLFERDEPWGPAFFVTNAEQDTGYKRITPHTLHPNLRLQGSEMAFASLIQFFERASDSQREEPLHIFHFGDSQIEGDRITGYLRNAWQKQWGGSGPGYLSAVPYVPSLAARQNASERWVRHARFGKRDSTVLHERFGLLGAFATHVPVTSTQPPAWLEFEPHPRSYQLNRRPTILQLLFGKVEPGAIMHCYLDSTRIKSLVIPCDSITVRLSIPLLLDDVNSPKTYTKLRVEFEGTVPEVDAVGLISDTGVAVHNIPMRGSSGTLFRQIDRQQLTRQLTIDPVGLMILQYGGNAVPYMKDTASAERYGEWFASQIRLFKKIVPESAILVIGPSDMATKIDGSFVTYPMLTSVRDALQKAALDEDVLFWDLQTVMGGDNSMHAWVNSEPQLASSDHVHFTSIGARRVGQLLYKSIETEREVWSLWNASLLKNETN